MLTNLKSFFFVSCVYYIKTYKYSLNTKNPLGDLCPNQEDYSLGLSQTYYHSKRLRGIRDNTNLFVLNNSKYIQHCNKTRLSPTKSVLSNIFQITLLQLYYVDISMQVIFIKKHTFDSVSNLIY